MNVLKGYEQMVLNNYDEKEEFLNLDKSITSIYQVPAKNCYCVGFETPFHASAEIDTIGDEDFGLDDADIYFNPKENSLVFCFEVNGTIERFPIGHTAYAPLLLNTESDAPAMYRFNKIERRGKEILPLTLDERCDFINTILKKRETDLTIVVKKNEIIYIGSEGYTHLPAKDGEKVFINEISREHENATFEHGICSNENMLFQYNLNDNLAEESLLCKFNEFGVDADKLLISAQFATSDCGLSCMTGSLFYQLYKNGVKKMFISSTPKKAKHYGENSIEKFQEDIKKMMSSVDELSQVVEKMGNTDITFPAGTIYHLCKDDKDANTKRVLKSIKKQDVDELIKTASLEFVNGATAIDIYLLLNDVVQNAIVEQESVTKVLKLYEEIASLLFVDFTKYDIAMPE